MKPKYEERFYATVEQSLKDSAQEWLDDMMTMLDGIRQNDTPLYSSSIPPELRDHLISARDKLEEDAEIEKLARGFTDDETESD